jgi:hypothetical protein
MREILTRDFERAAARKRLQPADITIALTRNILLW